MDVICLRNLVPRRRGEGNFRCYIQTNKINNFENLCRSREKNRQLAFEKLHQGDREAARQYFVKAVEVTPVMAWEWIQVFSKNLMA